MLATSGIVTRISTDCKLTRLTGHNIHNPTARIAIFSTKATRQNLNFCQICFAKRRIRTVIAVVFHTHTVHSVQHLFFTGTANGQTPVIGIHTYLCGKCIAQTGTRWCFADFTCLHNCLSVRNFQFNRRTLSHHRNLTQFNGRFCQRKIHR